MSAALPLYQTLLDRMRAAVAPTVPLASVRRLALLTLSVLGTQSTTLARLADELLVRAVTGATCAASCERGLRRTLNDPHLTPATCYAPVLAQVLDWPALLRGSRQVVLIVDESTQDDRIHLLRCSLAYWGGSLPLAWRTWPQNAPLPVGAYWEHLTGLFADVAALLPAGLAVVVLADRAYAVARFTAACAAHGWQWVVRLKTQSSYRWRDERGHEQEVRTLVARHLPRAGRRWAGRGATFKGAGWQSVYLAGQWSRGVGEPVVVVSNRPGRWELLALYERRFWIEPGFRNDKSAGWEWERSQVQGAGHQERLLLAMAWATLVVVCVGVAHAQEHLAAERAARAAGRRSRPQRARQSVFTQGLRRLRYWLYGGAGALPWRLPELDAPSWEAQWYQVQARSLIFPACQQAA